MGGAGVTRAYQIADRFRKKGTLVVMGGIAITLFDDEVTKEHADVIIKNNDWQKPTLTFQREMAG